MLKLAEKPKRSEIRIEQAIVTPEIAAAYLDKNTRNRDVQTPVVAAYARDMRAERWQITGAPIVFDKTGTLIDGQHRLMACIRAEVPFPTMVVYGIETTAQDVIDTNRPRTAMDALKLAGEAWTHQKIGVARWILSVKNGEAHPYVVRPTKWSNAELIDCVTNRPMIGSSIAYCHKATGVALVPLAFVHYVATHALGVAETANAFATVFKTGVPDYEGCPAHRLRERLLRMRERTERWKQRERADALLHAWNLFAAREACEVFRLPTASVRILGLNTKKL